MELCQWENGRWGTNLLGQKRGMDYQIIVIWQNSINKKGKCKSSLEFRGTDSHPSLFTLGCLCKLEVTAWRGQYHHIFLREQKQNPEAKPNLTLSTTWLHLEILFIKIMNKASDKWQSWWSATTPGNKVHFCFVLPSAYPELGHGGSSFGRDAKTLLSHFHQLLWRDLKVFQSQLREIICPDKSDLLAVMWTRCWFR